VQPKYKGFFWVVEKRLVGGVSGETIRGKLTLDWVEWARGQGSGGYGTKGWWRKYWWSTEWVRYTKPSLKGVGGGRGNRKLGLLIFWGAGRSTSREGREVGGKNSSKLGVSKRGDGRREKA